MSTSTQAPRKFRPWKLIVIVTVLLVLPLTALHLVAYLEYQKPTTTAELDCRRAFSAWEVSNAAADTSLEVQRASLAVRAVYDLETTRLLLARRVESTRGFWRGLIKYSPLLSEPKSAVALLDNLTPERLTAIRKHAKSRLGAAQQEQIKKDSGNGKRTDTLAGQVDSTSAGAGGDAKAFARTGARALMNPSSFIDEVVDGALNGGNSTTRDLERANNGIDNLGKKLDQGAEKLKSLFGK